MVEAFTSNLTVDEHHAIRSVGFSPVGQVMGNTLNEARVATLRRMREECAGSMRPFLSDLTGQEFAKLIGTAMTQFYFHYGTDSPSPMIMRLR
jgi:hypothetical protein